MTPQEANVILEFLKRATLKPDEINAFIHIHGVLQGFLNPPPAPEPEKPSVAPPVDHRPPVRSV